MHSGHGRKKHDEGVDFDALAESQNFVPKGSSKHKREKNPWDDSVERVPKKKSSHRGGSVDFDEDDDEGDENLPTHAQQMHGSSKHSHKSKKHASKSDAYSADALEESFAEDGADARATSTKTTTRVLQPGSNGAPPRPRKARTIPVIVLHNQS